jgi:hypothetical protein
MARIVDTTANQLSSPVWAADFMGRDHLVPGGARIDPLQFNETGAVVVTVGAAGAAIGATSIPVDALPGAIPSGTILNFGSYAPVTVTVNDADVNATETTITVAALSGPIPAGAVLQFSGSGAGFAKLTAAAAAAATTLTVEALPEDIDNAATATFAGGTKQARLTAAAAAAATSLTVDELQFAVVDNETATYAGTIGGKNIPSGTLLGRTIAEREAGTAFGPWATSDDEVYLLAFDVTDALTNADCELYRNGQTSIVKENFLPGWTTLWTSNMKAALRAAYICTSGAA